MEHLPPLIRDLALILLCAGIVTVVFRRINQPVVLGYLLAGLLVGPGVPRFPTILDLPNVQVLAEIGVIFLLFGLGLEFSVRRMFKLGGGPALTAIIECAGMVSLGYITGWALGWSFLDSIFLGGILAISSTTIIIRAFAEQGIERGPLTDLVFGILVVEDLLAVVLLVVLSSVAGSRELVGTDLALTSLRMVFFIAVIFPLGWFGVPWFLNRVRRHLNDETILVTSLGFCFAMVVMATHAGFSAALGAFLAGSILAEATDVHRIEKLIEPLKSLFGAIFFTSVGMLIAPTQMYDLALPIAVITVITIAGKLLTTTLGARLAGQSLRNSIHAGMSLAQIGEFSFIIATLGLTLKVTSDFLYPIAIGVSVVTTFLTPYLIRSADQVYEQLKGKNSNA